MSEPEMTPFQKMEAIAKRVISVPKAEIDRREKAWKLGQKKAKEAPKSKRPKSGD